MKKKKPKNDFLQQIYKKKQITNEKKNRKVNKNDVVWIWKIFLFLIIFKNLLKNIQRNRS